MYTAAISSSRIYFNAVCDISVINPSLRPPMAIPVDINVLKSAGEYAGVIAKRFGDCICLSPRRSPPWQMAQTVFATYGPSAAASEGRIAGPTSAPVNHVGLDRHYPRHNQRPREKSKASVLRRVGSRFKRAQVGDDRGDIGIGKADESVRWHEDDTGAVGPNAASDDVDDLLIGVVRNDTRQIRSGQPPNKKLLDKEAPSQTVAMTTEAAVDVSETRALDRHRYDGRQTQCRRARLMVSA